MGKIRAVTMAETTRSILKLMARHLGSYKTITADNGSEFHDYLTVEEITDVPFYFATPHHSWERGMPVMDRKASSVSSGSFGDGGAECINSSANVIAHQPPDGSRALTVG